ncbi:hypothetical protein ACTNC1_08485 [Atopobiaceae bacterium HCP3S3_A4]
MAFAAIAAAIFISAYMGYFPRRFCLLFVNGALIALNFARVSELCLRLLLSCCCWMLLLLG